MIVQKMVYARMEPVFVVINSKGKIVHQRNAQKIVQMQEYVRMDYANAMNFDQVQIVQFSFAGQIVQVTEIV